MAILQEINATTVASTRVAGQEANFTAKVSDINPVIAVVNNHEDRIDAIEGGTVTIVDLTLSSTTDATTKDTGSIITEGGIGVEKAIVTGTSVTVGTDLIVSGATDATTSTTGSLKTAGGLGVAKAAYFGTSVNATTFVTSGDGTVLLPALGPVADPNTGLYFPAADTIGVSVGGVGEAVISSGSIALSKEVNHSLSVSASTSAATAGANLSILAGAGATTGAGGNIAVSGGAGVAGSGSHSGTTILTTGAAGTHTTGTAGNGGNISITGMAGGAASGAAGVGGNGSLIVVASGAGGAASSATGGNPGSGGAITVTQGNGGAAAGTGVAGAPAQACSITTGNGGASTHAAGGAGGAGSALTVTAGNGGAVTNAAVAGGVGGSIALVAGNAGAGSTAGSNGGSIVMTPGTLVGTAGKKGQVVFNSGSVHKYTTAAINSTNTATVAQLATGYITSTSAAGTTITLPTGTLFGAELEAAKGTTFDFYIDNTAGANTVTVAVGANMIVSAWTAVDDALLAPLDVPAGVTGIGIFRIVFSSATAATFSRIG